MNAPLPFRPDAGDCRPLNVCILGAAPDTGNLGVTALCHSLIAGIARHEPGAGITVLDDRPGARSATLTVDDRTVNFDLCGVIPTRRLYRRDCLWRLRAQGRLRWYTAPALRAIRDADAVIDITGGDSFTDLYGARRLARGLQEKRLVIEQGRPLILAPQTIGPFTTARAQREAAAVLRTATMVWCRDDPSLVTLRELLGDAFDPGRHRVGVDLAFALPSQCPRQPLAEPVRGWLDNAGRRPVVGLNVSGLILNDEARARERFGLRADYGAVLSALLYRLLRATDYAVLLIPHVITTPGHREHDPDAARAILDRLGARDVRDGSRVALVDGINSPGEAKWLISRCSWMCATRMHAAIAALSSGAPAAALAYSGKTAGVFAQCGQGEHVADLRHESTDAAVRRMWTSFGDRHPTRLHLETYLPEIHEQAEAQLRAIVDFCRRERDARRAPRRAA